VIIREVSEPSNELIAACPLPVAWSATLPSKLMALLGPLLRSPTSVAPVPPLKENITPDVTCVIDRDDRRLGECHHPSKK
jgi:hypothetical protein